MDDMGMFQEGYSVWLGFQLPFSRIAQVKERKGDSPVQTREISFGWTAASEGKGSDCDGVVVVWVGSDEEKDVCSCCEPGVHVSGKRRVVH